MPAFFTPLFSAVCCTRRVVLLVLFCSVHSFIFAQITPAPHRAPCQSGVNSFPYDESFEASKGGWFSGGQNDDWTWGTPTKTVINAAGQGTKCWITGGLAGNSYNGSELSWLQSPCFDLSILTNPEITFKVFWETERRYDGAGFEYSIDGGSTWNTLGDVNSNSTCQGTNWFNNGSIMYLGNGAGWSGNKQPTSGSCLGGSGSNGWLNARHSLQMLSGETNVSFRFTFGSGTTCNNFEGFAIDAVHIGEAPPNSADFTFTCGSNRSVSFKSTGNCPTSTTWDFGDPASGVANNTSTDANPTHVFSGPGPFIVRLSATFIVGVYSATKTVSILNANTSIDQPIKCYGEATGAVSVNASGSANPYTYEWNTSPVKATAAINGLTAGTYTVKVNAPNSCPVEATITLAQPQELILENAWGPSVCTANNGNIISRPRGGTAPYTFLWSNGNTTDSQSDLPPGSYDITITDANGCNYTSNNILIEHINDPLNISLGNDTTICPGERLVLSPGAFKTYKWQDNSMRTTFTVTQTGIYTVNVVNENGCTGTATIKVNVDCSDVYFPSAFTPNGDTRNDLFGPAGNISALKSYTLTIYDRFGGRAFYTTDPFKKWDGKIKGAGYNSGSFVWIASYTLNGKAYSKKGVLTLLR